MKMIDISWPLIHGQTTEYKDRTTLAIEYRARHEKEGFEETTICMGTHTGTHIEAPAHFIVGGKTLDQYPLTHYNGPCQVLDLTGCELTITKKDLERFILEPNMIVLLKTTNSLLNETDPFASDFVYLSVEGAQYLAQKSVKAVGTDYLSVERGDPDHAVHKTLFEKDVLIIEGLRLASVVQGQYHLFCLPVPLKGTEAAPACAVLVTGLL